MPKLSVTYFYREPRKTGVSIEGIFRLVKECLAGEADIKEFYCDPKLSRSQNTALAKKHAGAINHITGDVNYLALGLKGCKNILTVHDLGHYETLKKRSYLQFMVYKFFWYRLPLRYIDVVTVVSQFTKDRLMEYFHFPESRIRVIPNPVKPIFQYSPKENINSQPVILMMGTGWHKNLAGLIAAIKNSNYHLDIIGWPSDNEMEEMKKSKISYTVYNTLTDSEVYERYKACDILFNASFYEGFGMPIIEAQAVGRAVITSNTGAMKEVANDSAVLIDPQSPEEIRGAIDRLAGDKIYYDSIVIKGRDNVKPYNDQYIAQQYLEVYKELNTRNK